MSMIERALRFDGDVRYWELLEKIEDDLLLSSELKRMSYPSFLSTSYWRAVKKEVYNRDKFTCHRCGATQHLVVHHLSYMYHGREHKHLEDLEVLCEDCHRHIHGIPKEKNKRKKRKKRKREYREAKKAKTVLDVKIDPRWNR